MLGNPKLTRHGNPTEHPDFLNAHTRSTRSGGNDNAGFKGDTALTMYELLELSGITFLFLLFFNY